MVEPGRKVNLLDLGADDVSWSCAGRGYDRHGSGGDQMALLRWTRIGGQHQALPVPRRRARVGYSMVAGAGDEEAS